MYLLLYVDDIILTASSTPLLQATISIKIKDMGSLKSFLGVEIRWSSVGFFLSQEKYAEALLDRVRMSDCKLALTPVDTSGKLSTTSGATLANPIKYQSLARAFQYLTVTQPDL
jgi:hypothetical protein